MRVPLSWLREYVRVDATADEIAHRLSISTAEVNEVVQRGVSTDGGNLDRFRVGLVLEAAKHPNADRLQLCRVDVGEKEPSQIVCGAWNFGAGAKVAVALPGATLPNGITLDRRELRGEMSEGMILAEDEVDLGTDHNGIMVLDAALAPGTPLADVLPLAEQVLDIEPTGNRPDLLSIYGIAREVAALFGGELRAAARRRAGARRRRAGGDPDRRRRGLPALRRPAVPRRGDRGVAGLAEGAAARRRRPLDLERRRRDELRDARARQPAPRVRLRHAARRHRRAPRAAGRGDEDARRDAAQARRGRPDDRRLGARRRARRDHGRRGDRDRRDDDEHPARGGELRAGRDPPQLGAARAAHRGLEPLGEGRRPVSRRPVGDARDAADRRAVRRALDRRRRRPR